jgi:hypothetical protein
MGSRGFPLHPKALGVSEICFFGKSKLKMGVAGLGTDDQKNAIAATAPITTAFKFCIRHRKSGLLNLLPIEVRV